MCGCTSERKCSFHARRDITNQEESEKPDVEVDHGQYVRYAAGYIGQLEAEAEALKAKLNAAYESASISESARLEAENAAGVYEAKWIEAEAERDRLRTVLTDTRSELRAWMAHGPHQPLLQEIIDRLAREALSPSPTGAEEKDAK